MTRQYRQHIMESAVERNLSALRQLYVEGAPNHHLAPIVDLIETLIPETGGTALSRQYQGEVNAVKKLMVGRPGQRPTVGSPTLRVVK